MYPVLGDVKACVTDLHTHTHTRAKRLTCSTHQSRILPKHTLLVSSKAIIVMTTKQHSTERERTRNSLLWPFFTTTSTEMYSFFQGKSLPRSRSSLLGMVHMEGVKNQQFHSNSNELSHRHRRNAVDAVRAIAESTEPTQSLYMRETKISLHLPWIKCQKGLPGLV